MAKHSIASRSPADVIRRLLIVNRGEIACRIIRTARRLGMTTIAVFSDADRDAPHVALADEAHRIGPGEAKASYLDQEKLLAVAKRVKADAVHPGYGFLSENADFAERCLAEGIVFVGPPPAAIRAMGEKATAKALMASAGVPLVPGYHGDDQDAALLRRQAEEIGYPVLIKASAGGGGKGMKVVASSADFDAELASAKREALNAFGDDRVLLERYLARPRHVEVQVFADAHGHCIHLHDRDCSVQRRHQKVIEEAPAPGIPDDVRERMRAAAVSAARAIDYVGAGTIEFLYSETDRQFYFMEMNTRLQVEHPVTEAITGLDLVEWQLHVVAGNSLPLRQQDITLTGHAIEVRLYAEDPAHDFLPQTGRLTRLVFPETGGGVRVDSGVTENSVISIHYDPMIAKLVVHGSDRTVALRSMQRALGRTYIGGLTNNVGFLERIVRHDVFEGGAPDTGFIDRYRPELLPASEAIAGHTLFKAVAGLLLSRRAARAQADPSRLNDPWHSDRSWRLNEEARQVVRLRCGASIHEVLVRYEPVGAMLSIAGGEARRVTGRLESDALLVEIDGVVSHAMWFRDGRALTVMEAAGRFSFILDEHDTGFEDEGGSDDNSVRSPMPGRVTSVPVEEGGLVEAGQTLIVVEAMKMEHALKAPRKGKVTEIRCRLGEQVEENAELIVLEAAE